MLARGKARAESKPWYCGRKGILGLCREEKRIMKAAECYEEAAKKFEQVNEYERAAEAQLEQAKLWEHIQEEYTRIHCIIDAAECFKKCSVSNHDDDPSFFIDKSLELYVGTVHQCCELKLFDVAVRLFKKIGR